MAEGRFKSPVTASLAGVKDFFSRQELSSRLSEEDRADGKTVLITGANSGLGFALTVEFARRGARVIMACRSQIPEAGERARKLSGSENIEMRFLDLSRIGSIHEFVQSLAAEGIKIDICLLNAAVALPGPRKTETGQDEFFQVNYLSNVTLTLLLIRHGLIELKSEGQFSRLLFVSSDSHQGASYIDYEEFGRYFEYGVSKAISNYSYFKLVLNTFAVELSRRINKESPQLIIHVICPGPVHSNIVKEAPWLLRTILKGIFRIVFRSPAKAALPVVYMALSPDYKGTSIGYLHMFNPKRMDSKVYEAAEGMKLWNRSLELLEAIDPDHMEYVHTDFTKPGITS